MGTVAPSFEDIVTQGQAELQTRRPDLTVNDGDVTEAMLHASAGMVDRALGYVSQLFRDTFIDGAKGDALTALVNDHYHLQRVDETFANVSLSFSRTSGGAGITILAGTQVATDFDVDGNQIVFLTNTDLVFAGAANGPLTVDATAQNAGPSGNVKATKITKILTTLADSTFSVSNAAAAGGGNNEESDDALRARVRTYFATLNRGTLAALELGARLARKLSDPDSVLGDGSAGVAISHATEDPDTLAVILAVSDADGGSTLEMVSDVEAEIENWRCAGVYVRVVGGARAEIDITVQLTVVQSGFDVAGNADQISSAITTRINKLKQNQTLYLDMIEAAVIAISPDDIFEVTIMQILVDGTPVDTRVNVVPDDGVIFRAGTVTVQGPP